MVVTAFADDEITVPDGVILYRRVDWDKIGGRTKCPSGATGTLNANCFTDYPLDRALALGYPDSCMSVGLGNVLQELGLPPEKMLEGYEGMGLAEINASDLRKLSRFDGTPCPQGLMACPTDTEPWHGIVFDMTIRPRKKAICKMIAQLARWTVPLVNN
jgi:hypothetical protein